MNRRIKEETLKLAHQSGLLTGLHRFSPHSLYVLAYHRIIEPSSGFDTFIKNVSATPDMFAQQMAYISQHYNVVSIHDVVHWLRGQQNLPRYPVLITFDDGYRDNYVHAWPILREHRFPAVVFLATSCIGGQAPFYWDLIAYCFHHTLHASAELPLIGMQSWTDERSREAVMIRLINALKLVSNEERVWLSETIPARLDVSIKDDAFEGLYMSWNEVQELSDWGIDMQAHTVNHPILSRISVDKARQEVQDSKREIEERLGKPVYAFAYPNGTNADFSPEIEGVIAELGFEAAFTLEAGPSSPAETRQNPMAIRRIQILQRDDIPRFSAKLLGLPRLVRSMS